MSEMSSRVAARSEDAPAGKKRADLIQKLAIEGVTKVPRGLLADHPLKPEGALEEVALEEQEAPTLTKVEYDVARYIKETPGKHVTIRTQSISFQVKVAGVSINNMGLAFFMGNDFKMELAVPTELSITVDGNSYEVLYIGGFYSFTSLGYSIVSFLFKKETDG